MGQHEIFFIIFSYILGSIPFGYLIYYLTEKKDIRKEGSGNIGATNVLRTKGKTAGIITLILDVLKGALPIIYGLIHFNNPVIIVFGGAMAITGHMFSIYLKFKGGKGVATLLGVLIAFSPKAALVLIAVFLVTIISTKYVSAGSIMGVICVFFYIVFTNIVEVAMIFLVITILIIIRHQENIKRIIKGKENRLKLRKDG